MTKSNQPPHLLLHNLLSSLSYWGTTTRIMLVGFVFLIAILLTATNSASGSTFSYYAQQYIYIMASLLLLDTGYVTIARVLPISTETLDRVIFLMLMIALAFVIVLPYFVAVPTSVMVNTRWLLLVSLFVLALRLVVGLFFGHRSER